MRIFRDFLSALSFLLIGSILLSTHDSQSAIHSYPASFVGSVNQISGATNITAPNSTSAFTMAGLGSSATLTPSVSGKVLVIFSGYIIDASNLSADTGLAWKIAEGTGGAPISNAGATGTVIGSTMQYTSPISPATAADVSVPFSISAVVTLNVGTAYWFDLQQEAITTASQYGFSHVSVSLFEL